MTRHVELPPQRFYWASLDGSKCVGTRRQRNEALSYLLEAEIPVALEAVHAIFRDVGGGRVVACAIANEVLRSELPPDAVTLAPQSIPQFLAVEIDPASLNLLTGVFTAKPVRQARRRLLWEAAATAAFCTVLLAVGLERRRSAYETQRESAEVSTTQLYEKTLGYKTIGGALPPSLQLQAELRTLQKTRAEAPSAAAARDAAQSISQLFGRWPADAHAEVDSLQVTATSMHLQGEVGANDDAQGLASALTNIPGWRSEIPSVHGGETGVRFTLQWNREEKGAR